MGIIESLCLRKNLSTFEKIKDATGLNNSDISDICKEKISSFQSFKNLPISQADKLFRYVNISPEAFISGNICFKTMRDQALGYTISIPKKWIGNKGSKIKSINNALSFYSDFHKNYFLRNFQIHDDYTKNNNFRLSGEILGQAFKNNPLKTSISNITYKVGQSNASKFLNDFNHIVDKNMSYKIAFATLCEHTDIIEQNMHYQIIRADNQRIIFESIPCESTREKLDSNVYSDDIFAQNIAGFFSGFATYKSNQRLKVNKLSGGLDTFGINRFEILLH